MRSTELGRVEWRGERRAEGMEGRGRGSMRAGRRRGPLCDVKEGLRKAQSCCAKSGRLGERSRRVSRSWRVSQ